MGEGMKRFLHWLRTIFVSGLVAIIPVGATIYVLQLLYRMIDRIAGKDTEFGIAVERAVGSWIPGLGILFMLVLILVIGVLVRSVVGRGLHYYFERIFFWFPGIRKMYGTLKQFTNALLNRASTSSFQQVVMFEYPKEGINVLGLVTNDDLGKLQEATGEECVLVYTPTAPNPLSGYMLIIPKRLLTYIDMPVEDALSMVVSSGSALPDSLKTVHIAKSEDKRSWMSPFRKGP
jgi:uncharacterized membrane protein